MAVTATGRRIRKRKLKADINVVPYIDVMLVLLIIFMVTAPLLNLGVDIELPQSDARPLEQRQDPVVVSVDRDGNLFLSWKVRSAACAWPRRANSTAWSTTWNSWPTSARSRPTSACSAPSGES